MIKISNIYVRPDANFGDLRPICAAALGVDSDEITACKLLRRSIDARKKDDVHFVCTFAVEAVGEQRILRRVKNTTAYCEPTDEMICAVRDKCLPRPVVIGFGPAGMFAALTLAEQGYCPIVLERGRPADERVRDVQSFWRDRKLNTESNVQFGEGGAGTFSDGKLNTGTKDRRQARVLRTFVNCGAPEEILYSAKPHIGTDRLVEVVQNIRRRIIELGGEVRFGCRVDGFQIKNGSICGVSCTCDGRADRVECDAVILAIGHSARDTFERLLAVGVPMEQKPFAVGARIEHSQQYIDRVQYGRFAGLPSLGAADYRLSTHLPDGRGVFTFCMCPGGTVVAAASEAGGTVTNGMSLSARDGQNANSALLVNVSCDDFGSDDVLAGVNYQRAIERAAYDLCGGYAAPAQRVCDFLNGCATVSFDGVQPTYTAGVTPSNLHSVLPARVCEGLRYGTQKFAAAMPGFDDGVLTGPETRSSSPVRILRDKDCMSPILGLYPCGEGAGYAGGIMSAAVDGIRCAEQLMLRG